MAESDDTLLLEGTTGAVTLDPSCLLVAVDDTGHEAFADSAYPLFGLGGCAVLVRDYRRLIRDPWRSMKAMFFGGAEKPLHASELRNPSQAQLEALGHFFRTFHFGRVAAIVTDRAVLSKGLKPYEITARVLLERIKDVSKWFPLTCLALVLEQSDRADTLAVQYFSGYSLKKQDGISKDKVPIDGYFMSKASCEPCLEVADFVMHAAGTQTRARLAGAASPSRKDFSAVFRDIDPRLVSFLEITHAEFDYTQPDNRL